MDTTQSFGERLRQCRVAAGLSQEALADLAGVSARAVSDLERGINTRPHRHTVAALADALGLSPADRAALEATIVRRRGARTPLLPLDRQQTSPAEPTPLVGRDRDISVVRAMLERAGVRQVTLTGPGGVGKTRLARRVAAEVHGDFPQGVLFVELGSVTEPSLVASTIARAIGALDLCRASAAEALVCYLSDKCSLLVLDNFEQVIAAAPLVADLLAACPQLKVLATSRAALHLRAEHEYAVAPLAVPGCASLVPAEAPHEYAAVDLFLQRARAVQPDFRLSGENASLVAAICRRLDGLPLAIELAAARVKALSVSALHTRLVGTEDGTAREPGSSLRLLTDGPRDLPPRQQTLRSTIVWSYDLLAPAEQALFRRLAVFVGGCSLEAAEAVGEGPDVLSGVAALIEHSLLRREDVLTGTGLARESRYFMLETVAELARELLATSGDLAETHRRHAVHVADLAEQAAPHLWCADQRLWLDRLDLEQGNVRAALCWCAAADTGEVGLRLCSALWRYWWLEGCPPDMRASVAALLVATSTAVPDGISRAGALRAAAWLAHGQGDVAEAKGLAERSLAALGSTDGLEVRASVLHLLSLVACDQGDYLRASAMGHASLALYERIGHGAGAGAVLSGLGIGAAEQGDYAEARLLFERSLALRQSAGDLRGVAVSETNLARLEREQGNFARAARLFEESVTIFRALGGTRDLGSALNCAGVMFRCLGDYERAAVLTGESIGISRELGDKWGLAVATADLADIARLRGDCKAALLLYRESVVYCQAINQRLCLAQCLEGTAATLARCGLAEPAARCYGAASSLRDTLKTPMSVIEHQDHDASIAALQATLNGDCRMGGDAFAAAWAEGGSLPLERALALVLEVEGSVRVVHRRR